MTFRLAMVITAAMFLGGCGWGQPYSSESGLKQGLVLVLPGIEGRSKLNLDICEGLREGGVTCAIEIRDWTSYYGPLVNLRATERNKRKAQEIAEEIRYYRRMHKNAPVYLVGQSGGAAIAVWTAEYLGDKEPVDGIILLAASLSPSYNLSWALRSSRKGIVSFYSSRDWLLLGTNVVGTMDGEFASSAGRTPFVHAKPLPPSYGKLVQVGWNEHMSYAGNTGGHLTSGATEYVSTFVAPWLSAPVWDEAAKEAILRGEMKIIIQPSSAAPPRKPAPRTLPAAVVSEEEPAVPPRSGAVPAATARPMPGRMAAPKPTPTPPRKPVDFD